MNRLAMNWRDVPVFYLRLWETTLNTLRVIWHNYGIMVEVL